MKNSLVVLLIFLFIGLSYSSGKAPLPEIKKGEYEIENRKGRTFFVDFSYVVSIKGTGRTFDGWLNVVLQNEKGNEIESFGQQIQIKPDSLQTFTGRRMIMLKVAKKTKKVSFNLGIPQKKY
jgi:hypothetical protein